MTNFVKMHGCGNDYIYFDCFEQDIKNPETLAVTLCNRNKSIGGDGIVLILPSQAADAKMRMYNADGSEASMCGNSIRCVAKYLFDGGLVTKPNITVETSSGIKELTLVIDKNAIVAVTVNMGKVILEPEKIPVNLTGAIIVARQVLVADSPFEITCVRMGNPHAIIFHDDIEHFDLYSVGTMFENSDLFPEGINLGIVEIVTRNHLRMRVWERGTGETMASGTGACAAAVASVLMGYADKNSDIRVGVTGGTLMINYTDEAVYMTGGCETAYKGMIQI